jgi:hypothetical protein
MHLDWNTFLSSGIGALVGSALTLFAAYLSHRWEVSKQKKEDARTLMGVLQAVHDEIETLWDLYIDGIGHELEALPNGQGLRIYYPVTQQYFTIYTTNALFIGRIRDNDLRKLIVTAYSKARGLIDSYRLNNDLLQKHERAHWFFLQTNNPVHQAAATGYLQAVVNYASTLKRLHDDVKSQAQDLLHALRKEGVLNKHS